MSGHLSTEVELLYGEHLLMADSAEPEADADRKAVRKHAGRHLFLDETAQTFFRRLSWSPDGLLHMHHLLSSLPPAF